MKRVMLIMYNQRYQDQIVQTIEYYQNMQYHVELENMTINHMDPSWKVL